MLNRSKTWAAGLLAATFVAGVAVGGVASAAWGDNDGGRAEWRRQRPSYGEHLQQALDLSVEQRLSVDSILQRRQVAMHDLWQEMAPRFDTLRAQIRSDILGTLDEAQREAFDELISKSDSVRRSRGRGGRHGR